jgi:hypothetical protein
MMPSPTSTQVQLGTASIITTIVTTTKYNPPESGNASARPLSYLQVFLGVVGWKRMGLILIIQCTVLVSFYFCREGVQLV